MQTYNDRKQVSGGLQRWLWGGAGRRGLLGLMEIYNFLVFVMVSWCIHKSNLIKLHTFNTCYLLFVNHTSIMLLLNKGKPPAEKPQAQGQHTSQVHTAP